jgi:hypothetical protein
MLQLHVCRLLVSYVVASQLGRTYLSRLSLRRRHRHRLRLPREYRELCSVGATQKTEWPSCSEDCRTKAELGYAGDSFFRGGVIYG